MEDDVTRSRQLQTALEIVRGIARDRSTTVVPVPGGQAVLNADFPAAHDLNRLLIAAPCRASALAAAAEDVLGGAGLRHRLIEVHNLDLGLQLADGLGARGYANGQELVMAATQPVQRRVPAPPVVELDLAERAAVASDGWRREQPGWDEGVVDQLGRRITNVLGAAQAVFFAVRGSDGGVAARADLYLRDGVGQVEEVVTDPAHRGRGLASLLVLHAVERARAAGVGLVFLLADAGDWPQHLYRRLGFTDLGRTVAFRATAADTGSKRT